jgi:hypothetical protein
MSYGQNPWPPLGSSVGHERAGLLSVTGHVLLTVDTLPEEHHQPPDTRVIAAERPGTRSGGIPSTSPSPALAQVILGVCIGPAVGLDLLGQSGGHAPCGTLGTVPRSDEIRLPGSVPASHNACRS